MSTGARRLALVAAAYAGALVVLGLAGVGAAFTAGGAVEYRRRRRARAGT